MAALGGAPAAGSTTQQSLVEDEAQMLRSGPLARKAALDDAAALGADGVRAVVEWRALAPARRARRRPAGFDPADPADYPAARWAALDDLVRGTRARGLFLLLSPSFPGPRWASGCAPQRGRCRPGGRAYGAFVAALGRRYSGRYADGRGATLPRVDRWSFGNEPNQPSRLRPQYARRGGATYAAAAVAYRAMVRAGIRGLRATGHAGDEMLLGETSPIGRTTGRPATRPVPPAAFVRTLLCLGRAAAMRGCRNPRRLRVSGFAHHPYPRGGSAPPRTRGRRATEITLASAGRLVRLLDLGARRGRIPAGLSIHYTEHGFQTDPPDGRFGVPLARQGEYLNQSDWIAFRNPRIATVAQYKLVDDALESSFQTGLRFADGTPKPAYDAYRLPLWVSRRGPARLRVYGQLRPLAAGAAAPVELQHAPLAGAGFRTVRTIAVRSATNAFLVTVARREGRWRLRWLPPGGGPPLHSREALAADR